MSDRPAIFLDIDGVLNRHGFDVLALSCSIEPDCVRELNRILAAIPDAGIVLSSAWRYMVARDAMTLRGFEYMLRTHGVRCVNRLIGLTCPDEEIEERGLQIHHWLNENGGRRRYVVIDDGGQNSDGSFHDMGISAAGHPVVWTVGEIGLTAAGADHAIELLGGSVLTGWNFEEGGQEE